jgi:hypothetical protein
MIKVTEEQNFHHLQTHQEQSPNKIVSKAFGIKKTHNIVP